MSEKSDGQEDQEGLVWLKVLSDAHSICILEDVETPNEQQRSTKIDGESDGDVACNI